MRMTVSIVIMQASLSFPDKPMKGGDILDFYKGGILEKGGGWVDLEKGGMTPLTNYDHLCPDVCQQLLTQLSSGDG